MENKKLLWFCSLPMKKGLMDNDYAFYEDGTIVHEYDKGIYRAEDLNLKETVSASFIEDKVKLQIMERCPEELKEKISQILKIETKIPE